MEEEEAAEALRLFSAVVQSCSGYGLRRILHPPHTHQLSNQQSESNEIQES